MSKELPPYFEEMLDNKFKTVNDSLDTLTRLAKDNQKTIGALTESVRYTKTAIRWIIVWSAILTASHIFSLLGKPLPISTLLSIL